MNKPSITQVLRANARGDGEAPGYEEAYAEIYGELRRIAIANRRRWVGNETLDTTSLIHEAYIRLAGSADWADRVHFYATAAKAMRHVLIQYATKRKAAKRGGGVKDLPLDDLPIADPKASDELIALHQALTELEKENPRQGKVVECRFFAGMSVEETAEALGVSTATVKRDWMQASTELYEHLAGSEIDPP